MKVLLVVHDFLPKHLAGVEVYTYYLAKTLIARGNAVSIYTRELNRFSEELRDEEVIYDGIKVKTIYLNLRHNKILQLLGNIPLKSYVHFLEQHFDESFGGMVANFIHDFYNPLMNEHFRQHLKKIRPDIIHIQHLKGLSASLINVARKSQIPIVLTLHDYWFMCNTFQLFTTFLKRCSGPLYGLKCPTCLQPTLNSFVIKGLQPLLAIPYIMRTMYLKQMLHKVNLIISPSLFLKKKFVEHGLPEKRIVFSDNGINRNPLKPLKRKYNNKVRFAYIGTIMPHKGVHVLIEAFKKLTRRNAELWIFGDHGIATKYYDRLKRMSASQNINFKGQFDNNRVYEILAEIDVLVVPSIWFENSPITMHEAALAGVPVIASNIGGMSELVKRLKNGLLFQVENSDDLYKKMKFFVDNPRRIDKFEIRAEKVKSIEENVNELEKIYAQLIHEEKRQKVA